MSLQRELRGGSVGGPKQSHDFIQFLDEIASRTVLADSVWKGLQ